MGRKTLDHLNRYQVEDGGCWKFTGPLTPKGYGRAGSFGVAHRFFYTQMVGPIPPEMTVDHLCKNTSCVNPAHMEIVTRAENTRRAREAANVRTVCKHGHELTEENTFTTRDGYRECRECRRRYLDDFWAVRGGRPSRAKANR